MDVTELRLGNLLKDSNGGIFSLSAWYLCRMQVRKNTGEDEIFTPVYLNRSFLLDLDVKEQELIPMIRISNCFHKIFKYEFNQFTALSIENSYTDPFSWEVQINGVYLTSITYVHQLQNLYFALSGEELKIKQI